MKGESACIGQDPLRRKPLDEDTETTDRSKTQTARHDLAIFPTICCMTNALETAIAKGDQNGNSSEYYPGPANPLAALILVHRSKFHLREVFLKA